MEVSRRPRVAFELAFAVAAITTSLPLFAGRYIPLQDLPQHVAQIRVLHDYDVESLGFARFFELSLGSTQYLSVYLLAHLFAYATGTLVATKLVLGAAIVGLPYALRALLRALGRPESLAFFALPLAYNAHLALGFLNFVAALPLLFWGLALAVRARAERARSARIGLSVVAFVCFYTHVVPYGMLLIGALLVLSTKNLRLTLSRSLPLVPSLVAAAVWFAASPAGAALTALARGQNREPLRLGRSIAVAFQDAPVWLTDVYPSGGGKHTLIGWLALALFAIVVRRCEALDRRVLRFRERHARSMALSGTQDGSARAALVAVDHGAVLRLSLLVPIACFGYLVLPEAYAFMWPIHARFPLLVLLCAIPMLPTQSAGLRTVTVSACLGLSAHATFMAWQAFRDASAREYAGLSEIVTEIPEGSRVAGLIFSRGSEYLRFAPYLHAVAWVQAERGGAVMFSFADFPASPVRFRETNRPPRVPPRWEWMPELVDPARDLDFFDYVVTRAGPERLSEFQLLRRRQDWSLFGRP